ncbi:hypothetical protein EMPG_14459 [Blastomyces silverae]|uniref:Uncharacterized protein n=1 Tax=Blastomyces silverae TaxID=2060906 RepID=A0A0H1BLV1_9EURO|nr:hypothetical protein EMPG_14459 [Blastomyces silverae]
MSAPQNYHETLTKLLATRGNQVFDIHFLPDGFGDLLHQGNEIGISKKVLVQCFIKARQIFFSLTILQPEPKTFEPSRNQRRSAPEASFDDALQSPPTSLHSSPEDSSQSLLLQTEILLLLDSEHLTACNWRKRRLCALKEENQSQPPTSANQYLSALHTEISFTTTILRSPLHRHTKSPVLWYHRKWTMMQLLGVCRDDPVAPFAGSHHLPHYGAGTDANAAATATTAAVNQILSYEVSIVLQAGTHHPKNYYAFSYLREFMGLFADALASARCQVLLTTTATTGLQQPVMIRLGVLARMVLETVHTWCLTYSHRRDISAWSFLLWLLEVVGEADGDGDGDEDNGDASTLRKAIVDKTALLGAEVSWDGEGLWIFVDLAMKRFGVDVDWLTMESGGPDADGDDAALDDINCPGTAPAPAAPAPAAPAAPAPAAGATTATGNPPFSSHSSKRWKIWIRRMKASQKRNGATTVVNDNG